MDDDALHLGLFDGITAAGVSVEVDVNRRSASALATFHADGRPRWSMSLWLDGDVLEGFILRGETAALELVVRDLTAVRDEPLLAAVADAVCRAGGFRLPDPTPPDPTPPGLGGV